MHQFTYPLPCALACALFAAPLAHAGDDATFTPLGVLDPSTHPAGSMALGCSADGSIVVGTSFLNHDEMLDTRAVTWSLRDGVIAYPPPLDGLPSSMGFAISADGTVIAGAQGFVAGPFFFELRNGSLWTDGTPGSPTIGKIPSYIAEDVSDDGTVIVGVTRQESPQPIPRRAFVFEQPNHTFELETLRGGSYSWAKAVSENGDVVVGFGDSQGTQTAFRWTEPTGMQAVIDTSGKLQSEFNGISPDGNILVGKLGNEAMYWTEASGAVSIGTLQPGQFCTALDVTANGSMICGQCYGDGGPVGFLWTPNDGMRSLEDVLVNEYSLKLTAFAIGMPTGLSDDGAVIVGTGSNGFEVSEAWRVDLPEPVYGDVNGDRTVNLFDLLDLLGAWGPCGGICLSDLDSSGGVDVFDLLTLLANWG